MTTTGTLHTDLRQFSVCQQPTRCRFCPALCFTEGVDYLRQNANAFWLVDAIASYYGPAGKSIQRLGDDFAAFHVWTLTPLDGGAILEAQMDSGEPALIRQVIEYTDFPFDGTEPFKLFSAKTVIGADAAWLLMLPSEY